LPAFVASDRKDPSFLFMAGHYSQERVIDRTIPGGKLCRSRGPRLGLVAEQVLVVKRAHLITGLLQQQTHQVFETGVQPQHGMAQLLVRQVQGLNDALDTITVGSVWLGPVDDVLQPLAHVKTGRLEREALTLFAEHDLASSGYRL